MDVSEKAHSVNGVLFQNKGGNRKVLTYVSIALDTTEQRHPMCTRHAAAVAKLIQKNGTHSNGTPTDGFNNTQCIHHISSIHNDITAEEEGFTDGCCYSHPQEGLKAAYAVVRKAETGFEEVQTGRLKGRGSAQLAELRGMISALNWAEGKKV